MSLVLFAFTLGCVVFVIMANRPKRRARPPGQASGQADNNESFWSALWMGSDSNNASNSGPDYTPPADHGHHHDHHHHSSQSDYGFGGHSSHDNSSFSGGDCGGHDH